MGKILIYNTHIEIHDCVEGQYFQIEKRFSYKKNQFLPWVKTGIYFDNQKRIAYLPKGIDVGLLEQYIGEIAEEVNSPDPVGNLTSIQLKTLPRNDIQRDALRFTLGEGAYLRNKYAPQLALNLDTGEGKTFIAIATIAYMLYRSIIITYSIDILNQWKERILQYTTIKPEEIYLISGSSSINLIMSGTRNPRDFKIVLVTHSTLKRYGDRNGWDKISKLFKLLEIGIKVFDEAHKNFMNTCMVDFFTNTYKTYYLTATPARSDRWENRIYQMAFANVPKIDCYDNNSAHANYMALFYDSKPSIKETQKCMSFYGFGGMRYASYVINKPNFYKLLMIVLALSVVRGGKSLIFIATIESIAKVAEWTAFMFPLLSDDIGIFNSTIPKEERRAQLDKRIIFSTIKASGTAMDIDGLNTVVVLADPFSSNVLAKQTLGRLRAANTLYIDVVDVGFSALRGYHNSSKRKAVFNKYTLEKRDVRLFDADLDVEAKKALDKLSDMYAVKMKKQQEKNKSTMIEVCRRVTPKKKTE